MEMDTHSRVRSNGSCLWENLNTVRVGIIKEIVGFNDIIILLCFMNKGLTGKVIKKEALIEVNN